MAAVVQRISLKKILVYLFTEGPGVFIFASIWSLREILANPLILGRKFDWYLPLYDLKPLAPLAFSAWNSENNGAPVSYYSAWLGDLLFGLTGYFGIRPTTFIPLFFLFILIFAGWGMQKLLRSFHVPWFFSLLAGLFYSLSPVVFIRIIIGFTLWLLAYALAPWILNLHLKALHQKRWLVYSLLAGLLLGLATAQIQFFPMISLILIVVTFTKGYGIKLGKRIWRLLLTLGIALSFHLNWLLLLLSRNFSQEVSALAVNSAVFHSITNLPHSLLRSIFLNEHHITAAFFDSQNYQLIFLISGLGFLLLIILGTIVYWSKLALRWIIASAFLIGLLITVLPHPHLIWLYQIIFQTSRLTNLFREVYHAQFLMVFALALAIGSLGRIVWYDFRQKQAKITIFLLSLIFIILFNHVAIIGDYQNFGAKEPLNSRYFELKQKLAQDQNWQRIWYPLGLGFVAMKGDPYGASNGDVLARSINQPFLDAGSSVLNQPSNVANIRNTFLHAWQQNQPVDNYLEKLAVNRIINRQDQTSLNIALNEVRDPVLANYWQYQDPKNQIFDQWQKDESLWPPITVYSKPVPSQVIFPAESVLLGAGSLTQLDRKETVVFLDQLSSADLEKVEDFSLIDDLPELELLASLTPSQYKTQLASEATINDRPWQGWSNGRFSWWYHPDLASPISPFVFSQKADDLTKAITSPWTGYHKVYVQVWYSAKGGTLSIGIGDKSIQIDTQSPASAWRWLELNEVVISPKHNQIQLKALSGDQAVGTFLYLPDEKLAELQKKAEEISSRKIINVSQKPQVKILASKPTGYDLNINNQEKFLLIFNQSYDQAWRLKTGAMEIKPIPVNGWANGFIMPKSFSGPAKIVYLKQKWYSLGSFISLLVLLTIFGYSVWFLRIRKKA